MMLRDQLYGKVIFAYFNTVIGSYGSHQSALDFGSGVVCVMQNAELGMPSFTVQIERTVASSVEVDAPIYQFPNLFGRVPHDQFHCFSVTDEVSCNDGVIDMFVEIICCQTGNSGHSALRKRRIGLFERCFADKTHRSFVRLGNFQGIAHTGNPGADN